MIWCLGALICLVSVWENCEYGKNVVGKMCRVGLGSKPSFDDSATLWSTIVGLLYGEA